MNPRSTHRCLPAAAATLLAAALLFASHAAAAPQEGSPNEYQVKAAFLFHFAKFIQWPPEQFSASQEPFVICVLGEDPFGSVLDNVLAGKSLGNHPVMLRRIRETNDVRRCQIVFVSSSETRHYSEVIDSVRGSRVLLVGETDGFAASGGAIEFNLDANHVRFTINPDAAQRSGLSLSSKLLMLARIVHDGGMGKS